MNNMILGRYIPGNSIIHQLDPRGKLLCIFIHISSVLGKYVDKCSSLFGFYFCFEGFPVRFYIKGLKSMILSLLLQLFSIICDLSKNYFYQWWFLN